MPVYVQIDTLATGMSPEQISAHDSMCSYTVFTDVVEDQSMNNLFVHPCMPFDKCLFVCFESHE
jgi:hypothetical protein